MKIHLTIIGFLFCVNLGYAQISKQTKQIDSICARIDSDKLLKRKVFEQEAFMDHITDNGATLSIYYKGNTVFKIEEWVGLSSYVVINTYYFQNNQLVFVKDEGFMYERHPVTSETTGKFSRDGRFIGKYYFKNGKLIHEKSLGHNRFEDDDQNDPEKEFTASAKKYLPFFYKK